ncbi:fimbria/pilus outer membrane usher protein [Acinetobacter sp. GXMZU3951]
MVKISLTKLDKNMKCFLYTCLVTYISLGPAFAEEVTVLEGNTFSNQEYIPLFLISSVNGSTSKELIPCLLDSKGKKILVQARNLRKIRIKLPIPVKDTELVKLDEIKGLSYSYDENEQILLIKTLDKNLESHVVDLNGNAITEDQLIPQKSIQTVILNYEVNNTYSDDENYFSTAANAIYNSNYGLFQSGYLYNRNTEQSRNQSVRLESKWQYIDAEKIRSYVIGDFNSNTVDWGSSLRLLGLQWSSAYTLRSDIITAALPQFSGNAALPSSLDLFVNQQKIYSGEIPSGPFDVKSLPFISGNEITLVTTDALGQQQVNKQYYYYSPKILKEGIQEFSVDVGVPRYNYSTKSNDYDSDIVFASGSLRQAISNSQTATGHLETSTDGLANIGVGYAQNIAGRGVWNFNVVGSSYEGIEGFLGLIGVEGRLSSSSSFNFSYQGASKGYYDLARLSLINYQNSNFSVDSDVVENSATAEEIIRAGLNFNPIPGWSISSNYNRLKYTNEQYDLFSLSLSGNITNRINLYSSLYQDFNDHDNYGAYLALRFDLSSKLKASTSVSNDYGNIKYTQELNSISDSKLGSFGWGVTTTYSEGESDLNTAYVDYRSRPAYLFGRYSQFGSSSQSMLGARGALVIAQGDIFASNEIGDAFAIVKNAGPRSEIINGGVNLGKASKNGNFLIPHLTPYAKNHIYLDTQYLPIGWEAEKTENLAIAGYQQGIVLDFSAKNIISATVVLLDKDLKPLPVGYSVSLNGQTGSMVGYDGEVFLRGLLPKNKLIVDLLDGGQCSVEFPYDQDQATTQKLGPYICS